MLVGAQPSQADQVCRALACSNPTRKAVVWLLGKQSTLQQKQQLELADLKRLMQSDFFDELLVLLRVKWSVVRVLQEQPVVLRHIDLATWVSWHPSTSSVVLDPIRYELEASLP